MWHLYLDEEGYPLMDGGIRADDAEFLQLVFRNLSRAPGGDRFPLLTRMEEKQVLVTSFDDPLIAQSIAVQGDKTMWQFLGGLELAHPRADIRVDEWNRLHAYIGPERIPAVMSRKAQADFLLRLANIESFRPAPYRQATSAVKWNTRYEERDTPWNMGRTNPLFEFHSQRMVAESGSDWLIPGAGHGHEIPFFASFGKNLTAYDLSPRALTEFKQIYPQTNCRYVVGDVFVDSLPLFDAVVENYFFVALDPTRRGQVLDRIHALLRPGGFYGGVFYMRMSEHGPAYGLTEWELRQWTQDRFDILEWVRSPHSHPAREHMEVWALFRKK